MLLLSFFSYDLNLQKKCYAEAKECFGDAQSLKEKFNCAKQLGKCLQNGAPTTSPLLPTEKWFELCWT